MVRCKKTFLLTCLMIAFGFGLAPYARASDNIVLQLPWQSLCADTGEVIVTYADLDNDPSTGAWVGGTWYPNETQIIVYPIQGMVNRWMIPSHLTWSHEGCNEPGEMLQKGIMVMRFVDVTAPGYVWDDENTWQEKQISEARVTFHNADTWAGNYVAYYGEDDPLNVPNPNRDMIAIANETWGGTEVARVSSDAGSNMGPHSLNSTGFSEIVFVTDYSLSKLESLYLFSGTDEVIIDILGCLDFDPQDPFPCWNGIWAIWGNALTTAPDKYGDNYWETDYYVPPGPPPFGSPTGYRVSSYFEPATTLSTIMDYEVYMWWVEDPGRKSNVEVNIFDGPDGEDDIHLGTVSVDQRSNGGQWNLLGTYGFNSGVATVRIWGPDVGEDATVCADALRFLAVAGNTPAGSNVVVAEGDATITFGNVTDSGDTTVTESDTGPPAPANFQTSCTPPVYYDITTTATYSGTIQVCLSYDDSACNEADMHLFHYEGGIWVDVTTSVNIATNIICGEVTSLSDFLLATYTGRIFVDAHATGANNGRSWADAYKYLQDALAVAVSGDEIFVAKGTYKPDQKRGQTPGDRNATFQLINGVAIKGGYAGFGEPDPNVRDIDAYRTILSGDIGWGWFDADNSYHVVTNSGTDGTAVLDGFTITAGNADGSYPDNMGGGMYNHRGSSPTIINCRLRGNAAFSAGAMFNSVSSPNLINCIIAENSVQGNGGGMHSFYSNLTLVNCIFSGNQATHGGAMYNQRSTPTLTNCSLSGNTAGRTGGGIYNNNSDPILTNSILWGNSVSGVYDEVGQIANNPGSRPRVHYCCVQGWTGRLGGSGNIRDDPLFVDPPDNLRLSSRSPCIDAGDNTAVPAGVMTDLDGHRRIVDGDGNFTVLVDMGAYEFVDLHWGPRW